MNDNKPIQMSVEAMRNQATNGRWFVAMIFALAIAVGLYRVALAMVVIMGALYLVEAMNDTAKAVAILFSALASIVSLTAILMHI